MGAGAVVNVAVAWGCALWAPLTSATVEWPRSRAVQLMEERQLSPSSDEYVFAHDIEGFGLTLIVAMLDPYAHLDAEIARSRLGAWLVVTYAGSPLRALQGEFRGIGRDFKEVVGTMQEPVGGVVINNELRKRVGGFPPLLPLRPIWPGFAINTILFAAALWLLIPGPFALRRFIRRRRGQCVKCGYPVGESAMCTECGRELAT